MRSVAEDGRDVVVVVESVVMVIEDVLVVSKGVIVLLLDGVAVGKIWQCFTDLSFYKRTGYI